MKSYQLIIPKGYKKVALPMRNEWIAALRSGAYTQGKGLLCLVADCGAKYYCCLGVLSKLQGRLKLHHEEWCDGVNSGALSSSNPLFRILKHTGPFPEGVYVKAEGESNELPDLADCNDNGLDFTQIADIIERVWKQGKTVKTK